jgi:hypothetical protein
MFKAAITFAALIAAASVALSPALARGGGGGSSGGGAGKVHATTPANKPAAKKISPIFKNTATGKHIPKAASDKTTKPVLKIEGIKGEALDDGPRH